MKNKYLFLLLISALSFGQISLVKDINNGTGNSSPENLIVFNNKIYFGADDATGTNSPGAVDLGKELWVTDGTATGTTFVKDLRPGSNNSTPTGFFSYNSNLYFSANAGSGNILFKTDGTESGTIATGNSFIFNPIEFNGLIYYVNTVDSNRLYEFNGTTTVKVANVGTGAESVTGGIFMPFNNKIFCYMSYTTDALGLKLYAYDPANDTFTLVKNITDYGNNAGISNFTVVGSELYFEAGAGILWKTDGTTAGTVAVTAAASLTGATSLFNWNGKLYFEADNGTSGDQLWVYDPAANTITNLSNITGDHNPSDYTVLNNYLYYSGQNGTLKYLYRTNGTIIERVDDTIFDIDNIAVLNGKLFFEGDNGTTGNELFTYTPSVLSIDDNNVLKSVAVYPNPSDGNLFINNADNETIQYEVFDVLGKKQTSGKTNDNSLHLNLKTGLYILKLTKNSQTSATKIIIK
ncbi:T9SS type A sorting domain-containing protein [Flavobacterium pectinovorum]|uniref:T9SS type A sorting domain-containing protein n=1 Tax=Flavobacterium pectinovorum TaxID=29533 RepID=UPI001FAD2F81|nr:T9SS type A sorting domain-containing protein [Flavobacterium pectinovorum]MCI9846394.1 T9SS type A sorting domain-containing protein [Flavobacterium pectinovorum]